METITVQHLEENFDEVFEKVEQEKKSYYITDKDGNKFVMMPYDYYQQYFENNNEAP
ncbi:antitoxin [Synechococcus phage DSL-LC02]|nr:antitoxin [Synechococcus phage DSL-LC02]